MALQRLEISSLVGVISVASFRLDIGEQQKHSEKLKMHHDASSISMQSYMESAEEMHPQNLARI
jgi:hypothetical protein